jgi:cysteine desulfurase
LGVGADLARAELAAERPQRLAELRDRLHKKLADALPGVAELNGHPDLRLPNTLNISIIGIQGGNLLVATPDVAASTGSACHTGAAEPSPVLTAMGLDRDRALGAVRLSAGRWSTTSDVDRAAELLAAAARQLLPGATLTCTA